MKSITVGITTRNRPQALSRALISLGSAADLIAEALVFDDGSEPPAEAALDRRGLSVPMRVVRDACAPGNTFGRNRLVDMASTEFVLLMDDDAALISREAIQAAVMVLQRDASAAVVAFAQAEKNGTPWPLAMQPAPVTKPSIVRSFIGFAHLVRRAAFREAGGYQELFRVYGEEKELCLRLFERDRYVVYLPDALVMHAVDPGGRDSRRYLRYVTRNDCLCSVLSDPWPRPLWIVPARLGLYFRMRRTWRIEDPGGFWWVARDLLRTMPAAWRARRPVSWTALRHWRALGRDGRAYVPPPVAPETLAGGAS